MKTVYLLGSSEYANIFRDAGYEVTYDPGRPHEIVCFTGGTDVDPAMYNEERNYHTDLPDVTRDAFEQFAFETAVADGKLVVGICRGAQLICCLSGGSIYQHINGHNMSHQAVTIEGESILVSSSHHQLMDPTPLPESDYLTLLSTDNRSTTYEKGRGQVDPPAVDYESVYFRKTRGLAHQPHPEWMDKSSRYHQWFFETVELALNSKL